MKQKLANIAGTLILIVVALVLTGSVVYAVPPKPNMPGKNAPKEVNTPSAPSVLEPQVPLFPPQPQVPPLPSNPYPSPSSTPKPTAAPTQEPRDVGGTSSDNGSSESPSGSTSGGNSSSSSTGGTGGAVLGLSNTSSESDTLLIFALIGFLCAGFGIKIYASAYTKNA